MTNNSITQTIELSASPKAVYHALMDSVEHETFTGAPADISPEVGGLISAYDGYIVGENVELIPGVKIVQKWRAVEDDWPSDHYSQVVILLNPTGDNGTLLEFSQTNLPAGKADTFSEGWQDYYWEPMKEYFLEK